jgi:hypothetical protein
MTIDTKQVTGNDLLDRFDTDFPAGSLLEIRSGAPAGAENAAGGTLLVSITLPASPWAAAALGVKAKNGTWSGNGAAAGDAAHYRLKNVGDTQRIEGTVTITGGGGDLTLDNTNIAIGQDVTVSTFQYTLA